MFKLQKRGSSREVRAIACILFLGLTFFSGGSANPVKASTQVFQTTGPEVVQMTGLTSQTTAPTGTIEEIDLRVHKRYLSRLHGRIGNPGS